MLAFLCFTSRLLSLAYTQCHAVRCGEPVRLMVEETGLGTGLGSLEREVEMQRGRLE